MATYYVSPSGLDTNDGLTQGTAWQTIDKVNAAVFGVGDTVLFEGGQNFNGSLLITQSGIVSDPIVFDSYGTGRATVLSGTSPGITVRSASNVIVRNLRAVGAGRYLGTRGTHVGIHAFAAAALPSGENVIIENCHAEGYAELGIGLVAEYTGVVHGKGYNNVEISNCTASHNGVLGIGIVANWIDAWNGSEPVFDNIYIHHCIAFDNEGISTFNSNWSGSGIFVSAGVDTGGSRHSILVEYCEAYNNGAENGVVTAGPIGIWSADGYDMLIRNCESHHNLKGAGLDGGGFDIDGGCIRCIIENCYSHENTGAGLAIFEWGNNRGLSDSHIRYCVSYNDGEQGGYPAVSWWSAGPPMVNNSIHNCLTYNDNGASTMDSKGGTGASGNQMYNNILVNVGTGDEFYAPQGMTGQEALYRHHNLQFGTTANANWAVQHSDHFVADPLLINTAYPGTVGMANIVPTWPQLNSLKVAFASPARNAASPVANNRTTDMYGNTVPTETLDIGHFENPDPTVTTTVTPPTTETPTTTAAPTTIPITTTTTTTMSDLPIESGPCKEYDDCQKFLRVLSTGDIEILDHERGFIIPDSDGKKWRITIDTDGALRTTLIP